MLILLQFSIASVILATLGNCAPWESDNNIREFDLEWQCEQFCNRLKGKLIYNANNSACTCTVGPKYNLDFDSHHLEHKLKDLGFNFKIIDGRGKNLVKRDLIGDKIKKKTQDSNDIAAEPSPQDDHKDISISERLFRLRSKLLVPKGKAATNSPDNKDPTNLGADHKEEKDGKKTGDELSSNKILKSKLNALKDEPQDPEPKDNTIAGKILKKNLKTDKSEDLALTKETTPTSSSGQTNLKSVNNVNNKDTEAKNTHFPHLHIRPRIHIVKHENRNDRIKEIRERIRMRIQNRKARINLHGTEQKEEKNQ